MASKTWSEESSSAKISKKKKRSWREIFRRRLEEMKENRMKASETIFEAIEAIENVGQRRMKWRRNEEMKWRSENQPVISNWRRKRNVKISKSNLGENKRNENDNEERIMKENECEIWRKSKTKIENNRNVKWKWKWNESNKRKRK